MEREAQINRMQRKALGGVHNNDDFEEDLPKEEREKLENDKLLQRLY